MYVIFPSVYLPVYLSFGTPCDLKNRIIFLSTYLLLDWQIDIFLTIGRKSANQINGSI